MSNKIIANQEDFVAVADAIRSKAGSTSDMSFPDEFVSTIESISGEESSGSEEQVTVTIAPSSAKGNAITIYYPIEDGTYTSQAIDIVGSGNIVLTGGTEIQVKKDSVIVLYRAGSSSVTKPTFTISTGSSNVTSIRKTTYYSSLSVAYQSVIAVYLVQGDVKFI